MTRPDATPRRLPLREIHAQAGARFAPFAGWEMPLQYGGVVTEHTAVRTSAGVFDVSHMGRVELRGPEAGRRLRALTTFDVTRLEPGEAHYSLYCTDAGGIADDVFVYRVAPERWLVIHNAANAEAGRARLEDGGAEPNDVTAATVMLAVQGPQAAALLPSMLDERLADLEARRCIEVQWGGASVLVARTGYTGEDGFECILGVEAGAELLAALFEAGVTPAGLGARDTLRLEAALPLHGNDIDETTTPYEARLGWTVSLEDGAAFTGRAALEALSRGRPARRLAHMRLLEAGVPRSGYEVAARAGDELLGVLTSGTFSPTLRTGIAMGYLPRALARPGTPLAVRIRDRAVAAEVVPRPFYSRPAAD